jgi:hypothetical protein
MNINKLHFVKVIPPLNIFKPLCRYSTNEYQIPLYISFVHYEKPFDSNQHSAVFNAMKRHVAHGKYINIIRDIQRRHSACKNRYL